MSNSPADVRKHKLNSETTNLRNEMNMHDSGILNTESAAVNTQRNLNGSYV